MALDNGKLWKVKQILKEQGPSDLIDPSSNSCLALRAACEWNDAELVELLLSDPRIDPTVSDNLPIKTAAENLFHEVVAVFLRDGRTPVDIVFDTPWFFQALNPKFTQEIRVFPVIALKACIDGDTDAWKDFDLTHLEERHLSLLIDRARNHKPIQRLIRIWQLKLLGAPTKIYEDPQILDLVNSFGNISLSTMKRIVRDRLALSSLGHTVPKEIAHQIALNFSPSDSEFDNAFSLKELVPKAIRRILSDPLIQIMSTSELEKHFQLVAIGLLSKSMLRFFGGIIIGWALLNSLSGLIPFNNPAPSSNIEMGFLVVKMYYYKLLTFFCIIVLVQGAFK